MDDAPSPPDYDLGTEAGRARRAALLSGPRFTALETFSRDLAARYGPTPHVDPLDGGGAARLLLLLETPGPGTEPLRFVSRDNRTGTARNIRRFTAAAGLDRTDTVIWNAVPWTIHAPGARNRAPNRAEIATGLAELPGFLALMPHLGVAVLSGRVAAGAEAVLRRRRPEVVVLRIPHPSPTYVCTRPSIAPGIVSVLGEAARLLGCSADPRCRCPLAARVSASDNR